ncbi:MAG: sodium:proton antiporter [Planctomycetes bacterium]|nr:sodium:proton antiporter [Planctomycetota bacterium]
MIVDASKHDAGHHDDTHHDDTHHDDEKQHHDDGHADEESGAGATVAAAVKPAYYAVIPFVLLLGAIALLPLFSKTKHWWESNPHRFYVAAGLGLATLLYYMFVYHGPVEQHWPAHDVIGQDAGPWRIGWTVFGNAILSEYIPFIMLLFSLYTISGGIRISGDLRAHPLTNTTFIAIGGLLASFIGTTGAAMLLIRPLLETNIERKRVTHTVVFFIFVVCNCGGCLLPIGDPPLFLGYLRGVDFFWTMTALALPWAFTNALLLIIYYLWDALVCYPHEEIKDIVRDETQIRPLRIQGLLVNGPLLVGVILSVALLDPSKALPGTDWHPWMYLREIAQLALIGASLVLGSGKVRRANKFNYHAIVEVAALFCGIFICMQPALHILGVMGNSLGIDSPMKFFWVTGGLSAVLDNAPTYVVFFETAKEVDLPGAEMMLLPNQKPIPIPFLTAISLGAVFLGAMTYIGNGPNFMVRAIAEKSGVKMPSFFGYMIYSVLVLGPVFALVSWLFF